MLQLHSAEAIDGASRLLQYRSFGEVPEATRELAEFALSAGMYADATEAARLDEWDPHDVVFHVATRVDSSLKAYGARTREAIQRPVAPVHRPTGDSIVSLQRSVESNTGKSGLWSLLTGRHSIREHGSEAISLGDLAFILEAGIGIRELALDLGGERAWRYIPTGGAKSGLSAIVLAQNVANLSPGVYEYDAISHALVLAGPLGRAGKHWFSFAARLTDAPADSIHSLVLFGLRYGRPREAYDSIIYSTALKEVGAAMQSMALGCAERGLAFSPLGGGFAFADGLASSLAGVAIVGEVMVGRCAEGEQ